MNHGDLITAFQGRGCRPHQAEFAATVLEDDTNMVHVLESEPGMGKGFAAAALCVHAVSNGLAHRILVLCPAALTAQWQDVIRQAEPTIPIIQVDRRRLREMEAEAASGASKWPATVVAVASIDFAKKEVRSLAEGDWDLVVVDEAQQVSRRTQRFDLLETLANSSPTPRMLFLQIALPFDERTNSLNRDSLLGTARRTRWTRADLRDSSGNSLLPDVRFHWITHTRQADEVALLTQLQDSLQTLSDDGRRTSFTYKALLQSASSSPLALEQRLQHLIQKRNQLAHGEPQQRLLFEDLIEIGAEEQAIESDEDQLRSADQLAFMARELLDALDDLESDSKLKSLQMLLEELRVSSDSEARVCIFTQFLGTASYLASALSELPRVFCLTGTLAPVERERVIDSFARESGVLISTGVIPISMPNVGAVIFYDLPWNPVALQMRIGQFLRFGRRDPVDVYAFCDESDSLVVERLQRQVVDMHSALGDPNFAEDVGRTLTDGNPHVRLFEFDG